MIPSKEEALAAIKRVAAYAENRAVQPEFNQDAYDEFLEASEVLISFASVLPFSGIIQRREVTRTTIWYQGISEPEVEVTYTSSNTHDEAIGKFRLQKRSLLGKVYLDISRADKKRVGLSPTYSLVYKRNMSTAGIQLIRYTSKLFFKLRLGKTRRSVYLVWATNVAAHKIGMARLYGWWSETKRR